MKKLGLVFVLAAVIAAGSVFADHPRGFGIGVQASGSFTQDKFNDGAVLIPGAALTFKFAGIPIFWAINSEFSEKHTGWGMSGDFYIFDVPLIARINLHWYFGAGFGAHLWFPKDNEDPMLFAFSGRIPIGLSWYPVRLFEVNLQTAPQVGVLFDNGIGFFWEVPINLGVRFWL